MKIKEIRVKALLTQSEFAKELGVGYSTVQFWESTGKTPSLRYMRKLKQFCEKHGIEFTLMD